MTPAKRKLFDKSFQCHEQQVLHEVRTKATGPKSQFAKELALMKSAAEDEAYRPANMTTGKRLHFQVRLSDAETEATTGSLAVTEPVTNQPETEKYGITSNKEMRFKTKFYINLIDFEAWSVTIAIQELRKTIEWCLIHCGCPKMHLVSQISDSIR